MKTSAVAAAVSLLVMLQVVENGFALDETDAMMVAAFEHGVRQEAWKGFVSQTFCLAKGDVPVVAIQSAVKPMSNGVSDDIVAVLRGRGLSVYSADDCVYDRDTVKVRGSGDVAVLLSVGRLTGGPDIVSVDVSYYGGFSVCAGHKLTMRKVTGYGYTVLRRETTLIC